MSEDIFSCLDRLEEITNSIPESSGLFGGTNNSEELQALIEERMKKLKESLRTEIRNLRDYLQPETVPENQTIEEDEIEYNDLATTIRTIRKHMENR